MLFLSPFRPPQGRGDGMTALTRREILQGLIQVHHLKGLRLRQACREIEILQAEYAREVNRDRKRIESTIRRQIEDFFESRAAA